MSKILCTVYEKEYLIDVDHDYSDMYTEIFVPDKKIIIRILKDGNLVYVLESNEAQTKEEYIDDMEEHLGKVDGIREIYIDESWINACIMLYEAKKIIRDKMPSMI